MELNQEYWNNRYIEEKTGWDIGYVSTPIKTYIDQLTDKSIDILIPGGGNSYEAEYLFNNGFKNTFVVDIAASPLENIKTRVPNFPNEQLIHEDFFKLNLSFDLIIEQTFFCAINPSLREHYINQCHDLLKDDGKIVGLLFDFPLTEQGPPFGGDKQMYTNLFSESFKLKELSPCNNSIPPRAGKEFFINLEKK